ASAIQQIKINQNPYSAEYGRPGRGRIEIITKPGSEHYQGEANVIFRDARWNAKNAFASTTPPEHRHIIEGMIGGPAIGKNTWFLLSGHDRFDDQQTNVFAAGLNGPIQQTANAPKRESLISLSLTHQWSEKTTSSIRPIYDYEREENRGVGGTTLTSAGT